MGRGAHPDMHAIAFSGPAAAPTVWVGCDGGVFQSTVVTPPPARRAGSANNTAVGPWLALNNGLAITQPNYLAQTSVSDYLLLAGTQDNGTEQHIGSAVWTVVRRRRRRRRARSTPATPAGGSPSTPASPGTPRADPARYYTQTLDYYRAACGAAAAKTAWRCRGQATPPSTARPRRERWPAARPRLPSAATGSGTARTGASLGAGRPGRGQLADAADWHHEPVRGNERRRATRART